MFEKRPHNQFIQNWQKTIAAVFLIFTLTLSYGQVTLEPELSTSNGLPTNISRSVFTDKNGGVWVGTDAGIKYFPIGNPVAGKVETTIGESQVWAIEIIKDWLYIGTYDNGLFIFNSNTGELINHVKSNKLLGIRKFRKINTHIYGIYRDGLFILKGSEVDILINKKFTRTTAKGEKSMSFPLEVFQWNQKLHLVIYGSTVIYRTSFKNTKTWDSVENFIPVKSAENHSDNITSALLWKNKLYVGTSGAGLFVMDSINTVRYTLKSKIKSSLTAWDIKSNKNEIFIGLGNHFEFSEGFILRGTDISLANKNLEIDADKLIRTPFVWSLTIDNRFNSLWVATINKGVSYYPSIDDYIVCPFMDNFYITESFIAGNSKNTIYIKRRNYINWKEIVLEDSKLIACKEYQDGLILLCNNKVYLWNSDKLEFILENSNSRMELLGDQLYLFNVFGGSRVIDLSKKERKAIILEPKYSSIIDVASDGKRIILQTDQNLFYLIKDGKSNQITLDIDVKGEIQFYFYGDLLVLHYGNRYHFCEVDEKHHKVKSKFIANSKGLFPNFDIQWSHSQLSSGFWVGNNEVAIQLSMNMQDSTFSLVGQYYLGKTDMYRTKPKIFQNQIYIQRAGYIETINFTEVSDFSQNANLNIGNSTNQYLSNLILPRIFIGQNANFTIKSLDYFFNKYGSIECWIQKKGANPIHYIQPVSRDIWLNNYQPGIYRITIKNSNETYSTLLRVNERIFWALIIIVILLGSYLYQWNHHEQFKIEQKMVSLEIATLRSNLNPHFIFNTMNLIQSLIVRKQPSKALQATSDLASLNRKFLEYSNHEFVSLKKEIEFIIDYIKLEQMRFEEDNKFDFILDIAEDLPLESWQIPPLILQPLLENAIKHGTLISDKDNYLKIQITLITPFELQIVIINPFEPNKRNNHGARMGLKLVKDRLILINQRYENEFEGKIDYQVDSESGIYTTVLVFSKRYKEWFLP